MNIIIGLTVGVVGLLIGLAIGSGFLNLGCKIVKDKTPGFAKGLLIVFLAGLIYMAIAIVLGMVLGGGAALAGQTPDDPSGAAAFSMLGNIGAMLGMALSFVINAFLFKAMVPLESVGKGFLVSLIYSALWAILGILLGVVMAGVIAAIYAGG